MVTARVIEEHKTNYSISHDGSEYRATVRGTFFKDEEFPKVGDYVTCTLLEDSKAVIEEILPRTSTIVRRAVESEDVQVIVTNVDYIFVVMGLDGDFSLSRLERYLMLASQSGVPAVVILNKADVTSDLETQVAQVQHIAGASAVHAVSALTGENMDIFSEYITPEITAVLLGSSGAGKSTITNWLLQEEVKEVKEVRADDSRGRHTTTSRQLHYLPQGGFLIDTPGMRELGVMESTEDDEASVFALIEHIATRCKFSNCDHEKSVGCAVLEAIRTEEISPRQLQNYKKILRERAHEESKHNAEISWQHKRELKRVTNKQNKMHQKKSFERE